MQAGLAARGLSESVDFVTGRSARVILAHNQEEFRRHCYEERARANGAIDWARQAAVWTYSLVLLGLMLWGCGDRFDPRHDRTRKGRGDRRLGEYA